MASDLTNSLYITAVGMGLVFAGILLLWGMMAVLVRLAQDPIEAVEGETPIGDDLKVQAAIAAVTVALAKASDREPHEFPLPPTALITAWQAVMRARVFSKRGPLR